MNVKRGEWREKSHTLSSSPQTPTCSGRCQCGTEALSEKWTLIYLTNTCLPSGNAGPKMLYGPLRSFNIVAPRQLLMVSDNVPAATLHFLWGSIIWDLTRRSVRGLVLLQQANNYFGFLFTVCPLGWTWYQGPRRNIRPGATAVRVCRGSSITDLFTYFNDYSPNKITHINTLRCIIRFAFCGLNCD